MRLRESKTSKMSHSYDQAPLSFCWFAFYTIIFLSYTGICSILHGQATPPHPALPLKAQAQNQLLKNSPSVTAAIRKIQQTPASQQSSLVLPTHFQTPVPNIPEVKSNPIAPQNPGAQGGIIRNAISPTLTPARPSSNTKVQSSLGYFGDPSIKLELVRSIRTHAGKEILVFPGKHAKPNTSAPPNPDVLVRTGDGRRTFIRMDVERTASTGQLANEVQSQLAGTRNNSYSLVINTGDTPRATRAQTAPGGKIRLTGSKTSP